MYVYIYIHTYIRTYIYIHHIYINSDDRIVSISHPHLTDIVRVLTKTLASARTRTSFKIASRSPHLSAFSAGTGGM